MAAIYFLFLSHLGLAIVAQGQNCTKPVGGQNMDLRDDSILQTEFPEGAKVTFQCVIGYRPAGGSGTITCTAGNWSTVTLKCEIKSCGSAGNVDNGQIDYTDGFDFGDVITVTCNTGYILVGKNKIHCGDQGWLDRLPTCEVVKCDPPHKSVGGSFAPVKEIYSYSDAVRYSCDAPLVLNGSRSSSCSEDRTFQPAPPTCVKVSCADVVPENGEWVSGSRPPHEFKSMVTFKCKQGYEMTGASTVTCNIESQWSPDIPKCSRIKTTPKPTTTTTTTKSPPQPPATPEPTDPGSDASSVSRTLGIVFGVLGSIILLLLAGWYFGVRRVSKKKGINGSGNHCRADEVAKEEEGLTLS